ncbi:HNH endonuclease [Sphingomonas yantingensis]|uniref:HNH nuclease domain-containing protein n=1 Tax=Sphingomonas yantingensis TaxID=1241761 RepID=A0A7W9AQG0_9SPHN|nr:HNH endonuclease signature motif containing protein [Sphingomonas yantingensis]MBB5698516.1 hypothetical protein [Sphingomonas yantingensis]
MRYWWVNQNQTYRHETEGGFLWSPQRNRGGARNPFYDTMEQVRAGHLIFSFCDTKIQAVGVAQGAAQAAVKPNFGSVGDQWDNEGWLVPVEFTQAATPVQPKSFIAELTPHMGVKYAPLQSNGNGNQGVYLTEISAGFAAVLLAKLGISAPTLINPPEPVILAEDDAAEDSLRGRVDIGETHKQQLTLSRRGQGVFRANVRLNENHCRLTGISDPRFLVASHIKPWRDSTDAEKLDGSNGLLLSPHADRLFDRGFISFDDDGMVLRSSQLSDAVWTAWGFSAVTNVGTFKPSQAQYLAYHRAKMVL